MTFNLDKTKQCRKVFSIFMLLFIASIGFSQNIKVKNIKLNNELNHFSAIMNNGRVYFSQNKLNLRGKPVKTRLNTYLYTLISGYVDSQGEISNLKPVSDSKLGFANISAAAFTKDGKYMYFTTNSDVVGDNKSKDFKTFNLQIHRAEYIDGKGWSNPTELPFCNKDYSYAHPALSPDGKTLYFVSNMPGTKGRTDIFKVEIFNYTTYGEPERLDDKINSPRTELYPFVSENNKIYFSSNRRGGIGGYDIYSYNLDTKDTKETPMLLPEPINSIGEDFSFYLMEDGKRGFLTSRRKDGKGDDDIYYFTGFQSSKRILNLAD
ncbi:WD40 repeat protein [Winogradskyella wandonensis]|uniref:WD40 repeat protein n=1 Tax=Winogradskyella wandonensis TaxID=1442586 RepID=A0A4R1KW19_9FLAO|nr:PD40 domain-containing protein [Winogradskyella wandonensis]TCK68917.1 WD40 repeat protein [Winogradskyella wandonensis]